MSEVRALPPDVERVRTMGDFIAYLERMAADFEADREETELQWRQGNDWFQGRWPVRHIDDFLRQWAAWLRDDRVREEHDLEPPTWQSLALQIHSAPTYA